MLNDTKLIIGDNRMVNIKQNLTGMVFGRLTVLQQADDYVTPKGIHYSQWLCRCSCGNETIVATTKLKSNRTISCGCYKRNIRKTFNEFVLLEDYGIGKDNNGNEFYFDIEDYEKIKHYYWKVENNGYVSTCFNHTKQARTRLGLHRFLMTPVDNIDDAILWLKENNVGNIDHKNRVRTDCRKNNLREASTQENSYNKSIGKRNKTGILGVHYRGYRASIKINGKNLYKDFQTIEEAIVQRLKWEKEYYGEFAPQQDLFEKYGLG